MVRMRTGSDMDDLRTAGREAGFADCGFVDCGFSDWAALGAHVRREALSALAADFVSRGLAESVCDDGLLVTPGREHDR